MLRVLALLIVAATAAAACQGESSSASDRAPEPPATVLIDAPPPADAGVTDLPSFDPASGYHLDDTPVAPRPSRASSRERRLAQLLLRSTPAGALAAVDGVPVGRTPVLWEGELDGRAREFTFVKAGHSLARYRFVPVTSGIVHGTLIRISDDDDAGVPAIPPVEEPPPPPPRPSRPSRPPPRPPPPPVDAAPPASAGTGTLDAGAVPVDASPPPIGPSP